MAAPEPAPSSVPPQPTTPVAPPPSGIAITPSPVGSSNETVPPLIAPSSSISQELIPTSPAPSPLPPSPLPPSAPSPEVAMVPAPVVPPVTVSHAPVVPPVTVSPAPSLPRVQSKNSTHVPSSAPSPELEPGDVLRVAPPPAASPINSSTYLPALPRIPAFSLPPPPPNSNESSTSSVALIVGISAGVAGLFFILGFILLYICHRKEKNKTKPFQDCKSFPRENFSAAKRKLLNKKIPALVAHVIPATVQPFSPYFTSNGGNSSPTNSESENPFSPQARMAAFGFSGANFSYEELAMATNGFSLDNILGEGGFGYVHRGTLPNGTVIAVKQLKAGSRQGEREFQAEVETISRVHHKHLVSLVGYCMTGAKRLLVYEFVPNGTLEFHLHGKDQPVMRWQTRMKIAKGAAKGLAYLHEDCNPTIIHRDIKATNILLDSKFEAKVSDFGLAKIFSDSDHDISHVSTRVVGTFGYLAPEYAQSGKASDRSDVYSYGVMLLELITGQQPIIETQTSMSLVTWARPLLRQAQEDQNYAYLVDPQLKGNYDRDELAKMVACAAACVRHSAWLRPRMSQIVRALEGDASLSDLDDGIRPGHSSISGFFNYDSGEYDMSKFHMIFANGQKGIDR